MMPPTVAKYSNCFAFLTHRGNDVTRRREKERKREKFRMRARARVPQCERINGRSAVNVRIN
jgi:hypothetical protein